jgi:glutamate-1-semialdehyde 2,1-aminomutase/spore coat polysaccharide biosynthesis protein SpsF
VWDLEGKEYIDYMMANGSALLGHADERVLAAIRAQMELCGPLLQLPNALEAEVARLLTEDIPCAEMVTFGKNGSDVCTVVARLARAWTQKRPSSTAATTAGRTSGPSSRAGPTARSRRGPSR